MGDGPPCFRRDFTCPAVLRIHSGGNEVSTTGFLPSMTGLSRPIHLPRSFVTPCRVSYNPKRQASWFGLIPFRSPLLRESLLLFFPRGTEMFQFPRFPLPALCVQTGVTPHDGCRVSPFGHPRIEAWSAAPRGFSQPPTSFIGFRRQGIHRWLFVAWNLFKKMLVLAIEFSRSTCTASPAGEGRDKALPENGTEEDRAGRAHDERPKPAIDESLGRLD